MNGITKKAPVLSEATRNRIIEEVSKHIYEAELARGEDRYGRDAIISLTFFYDIMPDWVEMIADHYGIDYHASYQEMNDLFEDAWKKAYESLEPLKEDENNDDDDDDDEPF